MQLPEHSITLAFVQMAPVWLNRQKTIAKMLQYVDEAGKKGATVLVFGEAMIPGYPYWLDLTNGAQFNSAVQKEIHAYYVSQAIRPTLGDLDP